MCLCAFSVHIIGSLLAFLLNLHSEPAYLSTVYLSERAKKLLKST